MELSGPRRSLWWLLASLLVLGLGSAAGLAALHVACAVAATPNASEIKSAFLAFSVRGLVPQLALAWALWPALALLVPSSRSSKPVFALSLAAAAALGYAIVVPLWCLVAPGRAAVVVSGVLEHAAASLLATLVVTAAAWIPARLVPSLGPHLVPPHDAWDRF